MRLFLFPDLNIQMNFSFQSAISSRVFSISNIGKNIKSAIFILEGISRVSIKLKVKFSL